METNEAACSNKGTLSKSVAVTLENTDDKRELTSHHGLEDIKEENSETLKTKEEN